MDKEQELARLLKDALVVGDWVSPNEASSPRAEHSASDDSLLPYIGPDGQGWPKDKIPVEIFEAIGKYLSRDCLRNLRLSCKEFEWKMSHVLFAAVVVPFQPELYGGVETSSSIQAEQQEKGKAIADLHPVSEDRDIVDGKPPCPNGGIAKKEDAHQGMKVFKDWGPYINKFGMSFDVSEGMISFLPEITPRILYQSFWGSYKWSYDNTHRFGICERLEKTANRSRSMTVAFSTLSHVSELAISVVGGLGWLSGPDTSWRARFFKTKPPVLGNPDSQLPETERSRMAMPETLDARRNLLRSWAFDTGYFKDVLAVVKTWDDWNGSSFLRGSGAWRTALYKFTPYRTVTCKARDFMSYLDLEAAKAGGNESASTGHIVTSVAGYTTTNPASRFDPFASAPLIPNNLTAAQKEYLLEMAWAQRTFLASYTIAVIDNKPVFKTVCTLNIASLSSRYLPILGQHDFWAALPNLQTLKLTISPDWRDIFRDEQVFVDIPAINPSTAVTTLSAFLQEFISPLESVRNLSLGWLDGGEHAIGMFGRNQHVLCAPLVLQRALMYHDSADNIVLLPHVMQLTLDNCWITPSVLELFVQQHTNTLQELRLTSVSLTAPIEQGLQPTVASVASGRLDAPPQQPALPASGRYRAARLSQILSYIHRPGSWPQAIERLTADTALVEPRDSGPTQGHRGALRRIQFHSCGYALLRDTEGFDQAVMEVYHFLLPPNLQTRKTHLGPLMMSPDDRMLGEIIPHMPQAEVDTLHALWHMSFGWGDDPRARDNLEDGYPEGGSGRFSGSIERVGGPSS